jgi:uncharacterized protein involved in exopolysaccharide biosynthesis
MPEQPNLSRKEKEIVYLQPAYPPGIEEDEIDLLDLWNVLWKGKWIIFGITSLAVIVACILAFLVLPVTYQSSTVLSPINQQQSPTSGLSSLLGNLPIPISLPGSSDQTGIMAFLQSRTLKERLITKYDLLPVIYKDLWEPAGKTWKVDDPEDAPTVVKALQEQKLENFFTVSQDKDSRLITLTWTDESPEFSKTMLDHVIEELNFFLDNEYVSNAKREREFVEKQLTEATGELESWERQVPTEKITLAQITRERLAAQTVYTELRKQLELAKISEAKENISFKVLDEPFVPEYRYKPNRKLIVALSFAASFFFAVFLVFFLNFIKNARTGKEG